MKGDEETLNTNMFPKFHHYQHQQQQQPQHHHHHHQQQHHHQLSRECQTSEEDESRSSGGGGLTNNHEIVFSNKRIKKDEEPIINNNSSGGGYGGGGGGGGSGDGATIEVVKRPRGRPPGSKNKPKPPLVITQNTTDDSAMKPHVLEIPTGVDVVTAITGFTRRQNLGLCILSGSGAVTNVTLRQPSTTPGSTVTFHGHFEILSISATILPPSSSLSSSVNGFTISLAGPQGQIFGGSVVGSLVSAGTVFVVATSFDTPSYHRLPIEDDGRKSVSSGGGGGGGGGGGHTSLIAVGDTSGGGGGSEERESSHPSQQTDQSCSMSMYHLPSDVIWAPTPRQQQPPPPPPF